MTRSPAIPLEDIGSPVTGQLAGIRFPKFPTPPTVRDTRKYLIRVSDSRALVVSFENEVIPNWTGKIAESFGHIMELGVGWDSYRARPIALNAVKNSLRFMFDHLELGEPSVFPTSKGGILVGWVRGSAELELEFDGEGIVGGLFEDPDSRIERELSSADLSLTDLPIDIIRAFR